MTATFFHEHQNETVSRGWRSLLYCFVAMAGATAAGAQGTSGASAIGPVDVVPLVTPTSDASDRLRLRQLLGEASSAGFLDRSASRLTVLRNGSSGFSVGVLTPVVALVHNSTIPFSLNDGSLWAGTGWSRSVTIGATARVGGLQVIVAPTYTSEQNENFQVIPYPQNAKPPRSVWANPFHPLPESIDLPLRFGDAPLKSWDAGQSSIRFDAGNASVGFGTENLWWGPGVRNAITLSTNAAGFPHAFVRTVHPAHTRVGAFEGEWLVGQLSESGFFDLDSTNDRRALAGGLLTWAPPGDTSLTLGIARLVMARRHDHSLPLGAAFDILRSAGHPNTGPDSVVSTTTSRDQITSLFGRWLFPNVGFEVYGEWARFEEPKSLRDFLELPGHSEGYTLGLQWAHALRPQRTLSLHGEASYLEPDPSLRLRPVATTYTSKAVPQGFTEKGQTLGAAIGPGASSQWVALDLFSPRWRIGTYAGRIRWDNGVLFEPLVPNFKRQDVSLFAGLRGSISWKELNLAMDLTHAARFDYLFQAYALTPPRTGGIDLINNTFSVTLSSALPSR